jgi:simple sugar transport system permease protein
VEHRRTLRLELLGEELEPDVDRWQPLRAIAGAYLFGGAISLQLVLQTRGVPVSPFVLDMLPYVLSLAVLVVWGGTGRRAAPASLGRVFQGSQ